MRPKKFVCILCSILLLFFAAYTIKTWPFNFVGKITYRILGRPIPVSAAEDLENMKGFLLARRLINDKKYPEAQKELEKLSRKVSPDFVFFKEIYLYLGYTYDTQAQFRKEEDLYRKLQEKDIVFAKFMQGLYYSRRGDKAKARGYFNEALELNGRYHRLNEKYLGLLKKLVSDPLNKNGTIDQNYGESTTSR